LTLFISASFFWKYRFEKPVTVLPGSLPLYACAVCRSACAHLLAGPESVFWCKVSLLPYTPTEKTLAFRFKENYKEQNVTRISDRKGIVLSFFYSQFNTCSYDKKQNHRDQRFQ